jgi:hypothetical protein
MLVVPRAVALGIVATAFWCVGWLLRGARLPPTTAAPLLQTRGVGVAPAASLMALWEAVCLRSPETGGGDHGAPRAIG